MKLKPTPWIEPAHPSVVHLYEGLIQVYRSMKESQPEVDAIFDRVSSQIGFVVTTTVPVRAEVQDKGKAKTFELHGEAIKGTLFAQELAPFLEKQKGRAFENVAPGTYQFYLLWSSALQLKIIPYPQERVAEPLYRALQLAETGAAVRPEVQEPAHWFDPRIALPVEDILTISAIDVVYPEFRLAERVSASRTAIRQLGSYSQEPAHYRPEVREPVHFLQGMVRPEVREPAHFKDVASREGLLEELRAVFQKYGL